MSRSRERYKYITLAKDDDNVTAKPFSSVFRCTFRSETKQNRKSDLTVTSYTLHLISFACIDHLLSSHL
jgi:hypothetical protein